MSLQTLTSASIAAVLTNDSSHLATETVICVERFVIAVFLFVLAVCADQRLRYNFWHLSKF